AAFLPAFFKRFDWSHRVERSSSWSFLPGGMRNWSIRSGSIIEGNLVRSFKSDIGLPHRVAKPLQVLDSRDVHCTHPGGMFGFHLYVEYHVAATTQAVHELDQCHF